jgi:hypothetical protein
MVITTFFVVITIFFCGFCKKYNKKLGCIEIDCILLYKSKNQNPMIFKSQTPFECALKFITQLKNATNNQNENGNSSTEFFNPHFPFFQQYHVAKVKPVQNNIFNTPNPNT